MSNNNPSDVDFPTIKITERDGVLATPETIVLSYPNLKPGWAKEAGGYMEVLKVVDEAAKAAAQYREGLCKLRDALITAELAERDTYGAAGQLAKELGLSDSHLSAMRRRGKKLNIVL